MPQTTAQPPRVAVVVLGDAGRSPRTMYHARSLADAGYAVDLIGYGGVGPIPELGERVRTVALPTPTALAGRGTLGYLVHAAARVLRQHVHLGRALLGRIAHPDAVLLQCPPAIPALAVCWFAARLRGARLVVDWHNFGWTVLGLRLGGGHPAVRLSAACERFFARRADANLCVSNAMRAELEEAWGLRRVRVLHDRPPAFFQPLSGEAAAAARERLAAELEAQDPAFARALGSGTPLVVCPTSWTEDEEHALLLEACIALDASARCETEDGGPGSPQVLVLVTGLGAGRASFERRVGEHALERVLLRTTWLSHEHYRELLGAADLGLSLHRSTSGLDLPMKLSDMLGAELPICALDYGACLREVVQPGENGVLFRDARELAEQLERLILEDGGNELRRLRNSIRGAKLPRWEETWRQVAAPLFART